VLRRFAGANRATAYADMRFEANVPSLGFGPRRRSARQRGERDGGLQRHVHYEGSGGVVGHGQTGAEIGRLALNRTKLIGALNTALAEAYERARFNAREKAAILRRFGAAAKALTQVGAIAPSTARDEIRRDVPARPAHAGPGRTQAVVPRRLGVDRGARRGCRVQRGRGR